MKNLFKVKAMRSIAGVITLAVVIGFSMVSCGGSPKAAPAADELDAAIREASIYLNGKVQPGSKAVFLNITSTYPDLSEYILGVLSENAVNDGVFSVVDRQSLDVIRAELNFQYSGNVSDESAQAIGQMLGAQAIVSGTVSKIGALYRLQVKAIEVQTAAIQGQWSKNVPDGSTIAALTQDTAPVSSVASASRPASSTTQTTTVQPSTPVQPAAPAEPVLPSYKVGDTGPAGGLIFYDKGNNSGGWRYLEAAPVECEFRGRWTIRATNVENLQETVGSGRRNTQLIVEKFSQTSGEWDTVAQKIDELVFGGFDDWFLPSKAELDLMYGNLKRKNIGNFKNEWYWSSSGGNVLVIPVQHFQDGRMFTNDYNIGWNYYARPIRQVAGPAR